MEFAVSFAPLRPAGLSISTGRARQDFVVSPVSKDFPCSKYFVFSPVFRHFLKSKDVVVSSVSLHFWTDVGSGPL